MRIISIDHEKIVIQIDGVTKNNYDQNGIMVGLEQTDGIRAVCTISNSK